MRIDEVEKNVAKTCTLSVLTLNINGVRSVSRKGFWAWLWRQDLDVVCLQEIRAFEAQFPAEAAPPEGYRRFVKPAVKPGYSGVAIYTRLPVVNVLSEFGDPIIDSEGRYLEVDFGKFRVASVYFPSGSSGAARQEVKFKFLEIFMAKYLKQCAQEKWPVIICGDWNIAHKQMDLKNWRGNLKNSGFLPEERAWMDDVIHNMQFVDCFRHLYPEACTYTWWSQRGAARAKDVGWRIDYQMIPPHFEAKILEARVEKEPFFSDHAPFIVRYDIVGV